MTSIIALFLACSSSAETNYPSSSGPMGVGASGAGVEEPSDTDPPEDSGESSEDTGSST